MHVESGVSDVKLITNLDPIPGKMQLRPFRHWKKIMIILSLSSVLMCLCVYSLGKLQVCCDSPAEEVEKDGRKTDFHQVAKSVYHHRKQLWDERDTDDYDYSDSDGDEFIKNNVYESDSASKPDGSLHDDYMLETTDTSINSNDIKYSHHIEKGTKKLPNAIIIGVKKGGTRALLEYIRLHPDVRGVGPETHFFDRNYDRGLEWYRQQMPSTLDGQLTIEKTPSYFITKEVPRRLHRVVPSAKLLLVVRDPVTRALSDYAQTVSKRHGIKSFEQLAFVNYNNTNTFVDSKWSAVKIGIYAKHLERWLQHFPLEQICFISGENLIRDPAAEIRKVQDFLGLKRIITEKHFYFNETKGFPCLMKAEGNSNPHCLGKTKGRTHPKLDGSALLRLQDFYRPYNMKFYQMTGINFGWP